MRHFRKSAVLLLAASLIMVAGCKDKTSSTSNPTTVPAIEEPTSTSVPATEESTSTSVPVIEASTSTSVPANESDYARVPIIKRTEDVEYIKNDKGLYATITLNGFNVLSEGFDQFSDLCDLYCASVYDRSIWYATETAELVANDDGSEYENIISTGYGWEYTDKAFPTRIDASVFSFYNETSAYNSNYNRKYTTTGHVYDIETAKEVFLNEAITDSTLFCETIINNQLADIDSEYYCETWQENVKDKWNDSKVTSWYLTDSALHVVFGSGLLSSYSEVNACIPYGACSDFLNTKYISNSQKLCHQITEYGLYGREYSFDVDKDGISELLRIETDVEVDSNHKVISITPIIMYGHDEMSLLPIYAEATHEIVAPYIIETDEGNFFLYLETADEEGVHELTIYGLNDPDAGAAPLGENITGAFYSFLPFDSNRLAVTKEPQSGEYTICHVNDEDGQLILGQLNK